MLLSRHYLVDQTSDNIFIYKDSVTACKKNFDDYSTTGRRNYVMEEPWLSLSSPLYHHIEDFDAFSSSCNDEIVNSDHHNTMPSLFTAPSASWEESSCKHEDEAIAEDHNSDSPETSIVAKYPVEEPWLCQSSMESSISSTKTIPDESKNEISVRELDMKLASSDQHEQISENGGTRIHEDAVTTVILINSSICTMQRIAVLENEKLVELLLEPVKNNVLCDSVYVGVVTKLAPHMGGAFVNIGSSRPSFMDIKPKREPFVVASFNHQIEDGGRRSSVFGNFGQLGVSEDEKVPGEVDETGDIDEDDVEDDNDAIEIDSLEYMDNDFVENGHLSYGHLSEFRSENLNGSVIVNRVGTGPNKLEKINGSAHEQGQTLETGIHNNKPSSTDGNKWAHVHRGTKLIVQVVKEGLGTKGPTLTAYPKLKSRFWILTARSSVIGISKKISGGERTRLRVIAKTLQPPGFGLTVRTVASDHSLEELQKDLEGLLSTWKSITEHARSAALASDEGVDGAVPVMLHRAMGKTLSVVQDYFTDKVKNMVVDSPRTYHEVTSYLQEIAPNLCKRVELYSQKTPLFDKYKIEEEIDNLLGKRVPLDNGGYLLIEQTEALVSIDVNGGQCMLGQGTSQEKAILDVNLAAAKQIARELRLRDIGGIVVVDFIDMMDDANKRLVYEDVKKAVERDRSKIKVCELSRNGLMEITRKRVRPSVTFMISEPCTFCHGTGRVEALETSFSKIEHEICRELSMMDKKADPGDPKSWPRFILRVDRYMCNYLTSGKRTRLAVLSSSLKVWILLKVARGLTRGAFEVKPLTDDKEYNEEQHPAIPLLRPADVGTNSPIKKISLFPKTWKSSGK